jgi:hypothetical protein
MDAPEGSLLFFDEITNGASRRVQESKNSHLQSAFLNGSSVLRRTFALLD